MNSQCLVDVSVHAYGDPSANHDQTYCLNKHNIKAVVDATEISSSDTVVVGFPTVMGVIVAARTIEMFEDPTPLKKKLVRKQTATERRSETKVPYRCPVL